VNVVLNLQVPLNAGDVACFIPGRAKDLSAPLILSKVRKKDRPTELYAFSF